MGFAQLAQPQERRMIARHWSTDIDGAPAQRLPTSLPRSHPHSMLGNLGGLFMVQVGARGINPTCRFGPCEVYSPQPIVAKRVELKLRGMPMKRRHAERTNWTRRVTTTKRPPAISAVGTDKRVMRHVD